MSLIQKRLFLIIFILWLFLIPLIFWNGTYEGAKVMIFIGGGFFLTLFWLINLFHGKLFSFKKEDYWYWLWLTTLLIASIFGIHPLDSILGNDYRRQGVLFFFTLWLVGKTIANLNNWEKSILKNLLLFAVAIESFLVIFDYYFYFSNWKIFRYKGPLGTLGEPNATAGFIILGLFLLPEAKWLSRYIKIIIIFVSGLVFYFLKSLSAAIIFSEMIVFIFFQKFQKLLLVIFLLAIIPVMFLASDYQTKSIDIGQNLETRATIWNYSLGAIAGRPLLGYGAETTTTVFENLFKEKNIVNTSLSIDRSHNFVLDLLMWSGIVGAITFLGWLIVNIMELIKKKSWTRVAAIIGWLTFASVQPLSVVHWILLMMLINI